MRRASVVLITGLIAGLLLTAVLGASLIQAEIATVGRGGAIATALAVRTDPPEPPAAAPGGRFVTLPPGSLLASDEACAALVRGTPEVRAINATSNATRGTGGNSQFPRVTGNFSGTTDEILQWVACKWGIDEDVVRAQIAKESWWHQDARGDYTTDQSNCHPQVRTAAGSCPESVGLAQIRYQYHLSAFDEDAALKSSAYNLDYTYAVWRSCFEGEVTWLNMVERGAEYAAGDMWGCVGLWFAGRWYTDPAKSYIAAVQDLMTARVWESAGFLTG